MKHFIIKDRNLRKRLKSNDKSIFLSNFLKKRTIKHLQTRINNRCIVTGRGRSVSRFLKHSRIVLRKNASEGLYPGISKSS
jgi:ribosomal protein S14